MNTSRSAVGLFPVGAIVCITPSLIWVSLPFAPLHGLLYRLSGRYSEYSAIPEVRLRLRLLTAIP
jgi:hypothetical protein